MPAPITGLRRPFFSKIAAGEAVWIKDTANANQLTEFRTFQPLNNFSGANKDYVSVKASACFKNKGAVGREAKLALNFCNSLPQVRNRGPTCSFIDTDEPKSGTASSRVKIHKADGSARSLKLRALRPQASTVRLVRPSTIKEGAAFIGGCSERLSVCFIAAYQFTAFSLGGTKIWLSAAPSIGLDGAIKQHHPQFARTLCRASVLRRALAHEASALP
jgi:hypothetical protein